MEINTNGLEFLDISSTSISKVSNNLIMAWGLDRASGKPRYILELDAFHRGSKCDCICPNCRLPLTAVNAAKAVFQKRPHFRHPEGAARDACVIVAARKALEEMFAKQDSIVLPRYRRSAAVEGLSGQYFNAWVECESERVKVREFIFHDEVSGWLTLDDGRRLLVKLIGRGDSSSIEEDRVIAKIELRVDDPAIAMMSPEEILQRIELSWSDACWINHWEGQLLENKATQLAKEKAIHALDWLEDDGSSPQRRETLLHREVKAILEREKRICLPPLEVYAEYRRTNGFVDRREWSEPWQEVILSTVELEVHLGHSVPDVIASWINDDGWTQTILIEVTVTNKIDDERAARLESFGFPVLEIDISRMGGVVNREEFTRLVVDEIAAKRWLYHPRLQEERQHLMHMMQLDAELHGERDRKRQEYLAVSPQDWAEVFIEAFIARWEAILSFGEDASESDDWQIAQDHIQESINALEAHGYPAASMLDEYPLRGIVSRITSILCGTGIEYQSQNAGQVINAILCDRSADAKKFHTLYLIAIKTYIPTMTENQVSRVTEWRSKVKENILSGQQEYIRDTVFDRLLGLLLPKMKSQLDNPFGTPLQILENYNDSRVDPTKDKKHNILNPELDEALLRGPAFEEWMRKHPKAAKSWLASPAGQAHAEQIALRNKKKY